MIDIKDFDRFAQSHGISSLALNDYKSKTSLILPKDTGNYIEPTIIEERPMNIAKMTVFDSLFMQRILFLGTEIDSFVANVIVCQMLYLQMADDAQKISIFINSPGGGVHDGLAIYDLMKYVSCPVETTCVGLAASMGAVLLSSGDKRSALPHSRVMIHQPLGGTGYAQASDIEIVSKEINKLKQELYYILAENTGKTIKEIERDSDRDHWFTAQEALDYHLIDKIETRKKKKFNED